MGYFRPWEKSCQHCSKPSIKIKALTDLSGSLYSLYFAMVSAFLVLLVALVENSARLNLFLTALSFFPNRSTLYYSSVGKARQGLQSGSFK